LERLGRRIERTQTFNQGLITVEYLARTPVDMKAHRAGETPNDPRAFERQTLAALGMPAELLMRHRMPHFGHIFSSDRHVAWYISYLWSDTLSADAYEAFLKGADATTRPWQAAAMLCSAWGGTIDPADGYRAFRERDPGIAAPMRSGGLPVPAAGASAPKATAH
jgi:peptidyl-dipeptidase Dcp